MAYLTREQILQANDILREDVPVQEWGGTALVQGLTGKERDAYEATILRVNGSDTQMNLANARAKLVARSVIDETGQRIFTDDDVKRLGEKSAAALQRVYDVAARLSGLSKQDMADLTKNFSDGQQDDLPSD